MLPRVPRIRCRSMPVRRRLRSAIGSEIRTALTGLKCLPGNAAPVTRRPPGCLVLDQLDRLASVVADERERRARVVAHLEGHLDALRLQLGEDGRQALDTSCVYRPAAAL